MRGIVRSSNSWRISQAIFKIEVRSCPSNLGDRSEKVLLPYCMRDENSKQETPRVLVPEGSEDRRYIE